MALLNCPECTGKVSDKASACPHCGAPIDTAVAAGNPPQPQPAASSDLNPVLVLPMEMVSGVTADTRPLSDKKTQSSRLRTVAVPSAVPDAEFSKQDSSLVARNIVLFLVLLFIFAGTSFIPDHIEMVGLSMPWKGRFVCRCIAIMLSYGLFVAAPKRENPVGVFLTLGAMIFVLFF